MKCFEILTYAVYFRYTMLSRFFYLGKEEIYILHIILLWLCVAGTIPMPGISRPQSASFWGCFFFFWCVCGFFCLGLLLKIRKKRCWSKDLLASSTRQKTTNRSRLMGKYKETLVSLTDGMVSLHQHSSPCHIVS